MSFGQSGICQFTSLNFHIIPDRYFGVFPVAKLLLGFTLENFSFFLVSQAVPIGILRQGVIRHISSITSVPKGINCSNNELHK